MIKKIIKHNSQFIDKSDLNSVKFSLKQSLLTNGSILKNLENKFEKDFKCKYAIGCSSGTAALHLAVQSLNLNKKDTVIMPGINFISAYNICKNIGVKIFLADVDKETGQMKPEHVLKCIKKNKIRKISLIITMYLGGYPENIVEFYKIKKKLKCYLIEDACHALGAEYIYKNEYKKIGSSLHSDLCTFSFHPLKIITSGEGGMVTTNSKFFANKIKLIRSHGIIKKNQYWDYDVIYNGYNYRMSELNAALALSQFKKIKLFMKKRKQIFNYYKNKLGQIKKIKFPIYSNQNKSAYHLMLVLINFKNLNTKNKFMQNLYNHKIEIHYHYKPIYKFKVFSNKRIFLKGCEDYYKTAISLPLYFKINNIQLNYICNKIKQSIK